MGSFIKTLIADFRAELSTRSLSVMACIGLTLLYPFIITATVLGLFIADFFATIIIGTFFMNSTAYNLLDSLAAFAYGLGSNDKLGMMTLSIVPFVIFLLCVSALWKWRSWSISLLPLLLFIPDILWVIIATYKTWV
jgi:hypothetical protein